MAGDNLHCICRSPRVSPELRCEVPNPFCTIRKVVKLIEDPMSANLYHRQLMILDDFLDACTYAFWVRDLPFIIRLLELLTDRFKVVPVYRKPLESLLILCAVPPMLIKSSDALECKKDIQEFFSLLGYLLLKLNEEDYLQSLVTRAIWCLLEKNLTVGICCVKLNLRRKAAENSELPVMIGQLLEVADEKFYQTLLKIAVRLAEVSTEMCQKMIQEKAIDHIMLRLEPAWITRNANVPPEDAGINATIQNYELSSKLLWLLLKGFGASPDSFKNKIKGPGQSSLWSFRYAFRLFVRKTMCELDRNNLMGILLQCLELFPNMSFVPSGLAFDVALLSTATEQEAAGTWAENVHFTPSETNYEFKKMLLYAICYSLRYVGTIKIMQDFKVVYGLLQLVTPNMSIPWLPQQHCKLVSLALHTLKVIVPHLQYDFIMNNGPVRLLMMIDYYVLEPFEIQTLRACLIALFGIAVLDKTEIILVLRENLGIVALLTLCDHLLSQAILTTFYQECLAYTFCILELLYKKRQICGKATVDICMKYLKRVVRPNTGDPVHDPRVIICGIDFFWEAVVWTPSNLKDFVARGGVYLLLDIIQAFSFPVKIVALGALTDLCNEGTCVPHLVTWRNNGQKLVPMLLDLFRDENVRLGVKATGRGVVVDIEAPIMGQQQWFETFSHKKKFDSSPAVVDTLMSCRPKVYAILQLLNCRHRKRVILANEQYHMCDINEVSVDDQITLMLADNFLALKLGEAWSELVRNLDIIGIRPLPVDGQVLNIITRRVHKWGLHIKRTQEEVLRREKEQDCINERLLYNLLKESRLVSALESFRELDYIARTTERMFRFCSKYKQRIQINKSLQFNSEIVDQHRTYMHEIDVTPVFEQSVSIQSNILENQDVNDIEMQVTSENDLRQLDNFSLYSYDVTVQFKKKK